MLEIVRQVKAEAERELLLAQAKVEVVTAIEEKYLARQTETESDIVSCDEEVTDTDDTENYSANI